MAKPHSTPKRPRDVSQLARHIVAISTGEAEDESPTPTDPKNAKRGEARAAKLTPEERSKIAKKAAAARWHGSS
jgi:hypothetical protein